MGTAMAQELMQNRQFWAQGEGHCGDRGEETWEGIERAQIILVGREMVQKEKMICDNTVPLKFHCSEIWGDIHPPPLDIMNASIEILFRV